ncbi:MAG: helix-turn-helix domain-containing protein [Prevotellaceae bacterium]|jgi:transcriptional regulator with XRE-family HTH domain|nr:helix-turn-helix domain-containing protein [Prevotellaceae bacterium]
MLNLKFIFVFMANLLKIRDLCKQKKITIRELSNRIGIGESALQSLIKNGSTSTLTLEKIARELEVSAGIFFDKPIGTHLENVANNSKNPIVNTGNDVNNSFNSNHSITDEDIKTASLGYQQIILSYQNQMERLINIIDKFDEKYGK